MRDYSDLELVREYARQNSETAFAELVQRHVNLVYSAALRHAGLTAQAEEITQAVFIILARKAANLRAGTVVEAWLYETTRLTALSWLRAERRRQFREQEAFMQSTVQESATDPHWQQVAPLLDEAMMRLGRREREAIVLRFFKGLSLREAAAGLNISEAAAQKRVNRALEKLRKFFTKRGVSSTTAMIAGAIPANSVQAAPIALAKAAAAAAVTKGVAASGSTLTLIKSALKLMAWTKVKTAVAVGACAVLAAGTATVGIKEIRNREALPPEPIYDGKPLSIWLANESFESLSVNGIGLTDEAVDAVRAIGTNAIPYLLATLECAGSESNSIMKRHKAAVGFRALGSDARPASPRLVSLVLTSRNDGIHSEAINALMIADKEAIVLLTQALKSRDREVRARAALALRWDRKAPDTAIPALTEALSDADTKVRANAVTAIGAYQERQLIPQITALLKDPEDSVRNGAAEALRMIQLKPVTP